jgi:hypothetical protein
MNQNLPPTLSDKFIREHTASLKDIIFTRREFLEKTGMGMGALSLASILGMGAQAQAAIGAAERRWFRLSRRRILSSR